MSEYSEWEIQRLQDLVAAQTKQITELEREAEMAWDLGYADGVREGYDDGYAEACVSDA